MKSGAYSDTPFLVVNAIGEALVFVQ